MIRIDISQSHGFSKLSPESAVLFCMTLPHLSAHGKLIGEPPYIKGLVCPRIQWLTIEKIKACLKEINDCTNLKWFEVDGLKYLHAIHFTEHQDLRQDRLGEDHLPSYPGSDNSRSTPGQLRREVEGEVEQEDEGEERKRSKKHPTLEDVLDYFYSNGSEPLEAESFYDYFQSNGWRVGGKAPMKDWRAAARNWMRRVKQFGGKNNVPPEIKKRRFATAEEIVAKRALENGGTIKIEAAT